MNDFLRTRDCCGYWNVPEEDAYRLYWDEINAAMIEAYDDAINIMVFGDDCKKYVKKLMFFHYLYDYMILSRQSIVLAGTQSDIEGNKITYGLNQLEKNMICCGIDPKLIRRIFRIFGFDSDPVLTQDGINYMGVTENSPIFTIT